MVYDYQCENGECGNVEEQYRGMNETPEFKCSKCGSVMKQIFTINRTGFIIKGEAPSKVNREHTHRKKRNADLGVRQLERYGSGPTPVPNVGGEEVGSWKDAAKLAKDKGLDSKTYEPMINREKAVSKVSGMDDGAWKKAKEVKGSI